MATVLKTVIGASLSRVQIPAPPPNFVVGIALWIREALSHEKVLIQPYPTNVRREGFNVAVVEEAHPRLKLALCQLDCLTALDLNDPHRLVDHLARTVTTVCIA